MTPFPTVSKASRMRERTTYFPGGLSGPIPGTSWVTGCCAANSGWVVETGWGGCVRVILASSDPFRFR